MPFCNDQFYRYYDGGTGAFSYPTLLLHGLGGSHLSWPPALRRIPGQKIYALDLPGHGASRLPACSSINCHLQHLHEFVCEMGFFSISLVGHSMGAALAYAYANKYPNRVKKISLIAFGNQFHHLHQLEQLLSHPSTREKAVELITTKGFHSGFSKQMRRKIMEPLQKIRTSVLQADIQTCLDSNLVNLPARHNFPVQIIAAEDDQFMPLYESRCFANGVTHAAHEIINDCGHMCIFEKTDQVQSVVKRFLEMPLSIWS